MKKYTNEEVKEQFEIFPDSIKSMTISTTNDENSPLTSYSPFARNDDKFYIAMSSSMPHFKNIERTNKCHAFIIEDEKDAFHIFARKRLYFEAECRIVDVNDYYKFFENRFGDSLSFIKEMGDFKVIELIPKEKSLILGFGAAYIMNKDGEVGQKTISHK